MRENVLRGITRRFHRLSPTYGHVAHALLTLSPVAARVLLPRAAPRLACVKPAASVHPEPGSNSSLYIFYITKLDSLTLILKRIDARSKVTDASLDASLCYFSLYFFSLFKDRLPFFAAAFGPQKSRSSSKRECKGTTFFLSAKIFCDFF